MSRSIPPKQLREIRAQLDEHRLRLFSSGLLTSAREVERLVAVIDGALVKKRRESKLRWSKPTRAEKRAAKKDETAEIHKRVFARANGLCELCLRAAPTELHHVHGRVREKQSERSCLGLCASCHKNLTLNRPGAADCWADIRDIFRRLGFEPEARKADNHRLWHLAREGRAA